MKTETLHIPDITCAHCAKQVRKALMPLAGVNNVEVDISGRTATLAYDPDVLDRKNALQALADAGYPVAERNESVNAEADGRCCCSGSACHR